MRLWIFSPTSWNTGIKDNIPDDDPVTLTNMEGVQEMSQCLDPYLPAVF